MSWSLFRWVWRIESPLSIGIPPSRGLNRCRMYVPARNYWAALTADLAERQAAGYPDYAGVGQAIRTDTRLTYLYPAEEKDQGWAAWLPRYQNGRGLVWQQGDDSKGTEAIADREMRRRLLMARPGTAIDPDSDAAADGTLRETECIGDHWRDPTMNAARPVALVGYVALRGGTDLAAAIEESKTLHIGGDTRYGLGRLRRIAWDPTSEVFGAPTDLKGPDPCVTSERILAHADVPDGSMELEGDREALVGWDYGKISALPGASIYWRPGSVSGKTPRRWGIQESGLWAAN